MTSAILVAYTSLYLAAVLSPAFGFWAVLLFAIESHGQRPPARPPQ